MYMCSCIYIYACLHYYKTLEYTMNNMLHHLSSCPPPLSSLPPSLPPSLPSLSPHAQLLSSHYTYFARYYESGMLGQKNLGLASEEEKMWSALVVYRLLDTLSNRMPQEKLERSCVSCLQAVSCAIFPDTLLPPQRQLNSMCQSSSLGYEPHPADISRVTLLRPELKQFVHDFASYEHDCWVFDQVWASVLFLRCPVLSYSLSLSLSPLILFIMCLIAHPSNLRAGPMDLNTLRRTTSAQN